MVARCRCWCLCIGRQQQLINIIGSVNVTMTMTIGVWVILLLQIAIKDSVNVRMTKGEDFLTGRDGNQGNLNTAKEAEFAGFLNETIASLGEGKKEVAGCKEMR